MSLRAYDGDPALKAKVINDVATDADRGWFINASLVERQETARAAHLDPAFVGLITTATLLPWPEGKTSAIEAFEALAPGADTAGLVRDWMVEIYRHPSHGVARKLAAPAGRQAAEAIVAMVEAGGPKSRAVWKSARSTLLAAPGLRPVERAYARVVAAMAWDIEASPGVASDVWIAWQHAVTTECDLGAGWDQESQNQISEALRKAMQQAFSEVAPPGQDATPQELKDHAVERQARIDELLAREGLDQDWRALSAYWENHLGPHLRGWRSTALATLCRACREALAFEAVAEGASQAATHVVGAQ
uniref:hypothetical protein n=1 Tax=uncultured Caulobacter sp. TaxID=158749 RepID=UPI0025CEC992|nr:hypothetical protein [uncultured Caulobacter sp.]